MIWVGFATGSGSIFLKVLEIQIRQMIRIRIQNPVSNATRRRKFISLVTHFSTHRLQRAPRMVQL